MRMQNYFYDPRIDLNDTQAISRWLKESPETFIKTFVQEVKAYSGLINDYAQLAGEDENVHGITIAGWTNADGNNATLPEIMNWVVNHAKSIETLMDVLITYFNQSKITPE